MAGSGTDVGKTIASAILTTLFKGDYWKPIQCGEGEQADTSFMKTLIDTSQHRIHPPAYSLKAPLSPHHAARLENLSICLDNIVPPRAAHALIIETVGGIFSPLAKNILSLDLFKRWESHWILISRHYLGSINHTLLTLDALKRHGISIAGIIFNGTPNPDSESCILKISQVPMLGRLLPEAHFNPPLIQRYAEQWKPRLFSLIP